MEFVMDEAARGESNRSIPADVVQYPKYNAISGSTVQMSIHSPKMSASPLVSGQGFEGGKKYHIKLTKVRGLLVLSFDGC